LSDEVRVAVSSDSDIVEARQQGRELATKLGFSSTDLTLIVTAISEIARNIVVYAHHGEIILRSVRNSYQKGIVVVARDSGPGIADVQSAMRDAYSTGEGLGLGLPGAKRLMDEFEIDSEVDKGTTITMTKWRPDV
jgi:serine/threonine-protein kinase RsbT